MNEELLNKRSNLTKNNLGKKNKINEMSLDIKRILDLSLMQTTTSFDKDNCINLIKEYIDKYDRLLYSVISNYIFLLDSEHQGIYITNLDSLTEFILSEEYSEKYKNKISNDVQLKIKKTISKLWDHSHLALNQFKSLKQSDEEFGRNFVKSIEPVKQDVNKQLNNFTKSMNSQLISLVGIFTAMSFLVFGAINSLDEIFKNAQSIPILQIMIVGSVWGLCVTNLVFVFMFFVSKMTAMNIKSSLDKNASLIQKYPLVLWSNLILITILSICSWLYYIDREDIGGWFVNIGKNNSEVVCVAGFIVVLLIFIICARHLLNEYDKDKSNETEVPIQSKSIILDSFSKLSDIIRGKNISNE